MADFSLPVNACDFDDTNPPALGIVGTTGGRRKIRFDTDTDEIIYWTFYLPENYSSAPVLDSLWAFETATSGTMNVECEVMATTPGDAALHDTDSYDTVNAGSGTVPATAGHTVEISTTLTNFDSGAAGDMITLKFRRNISGGSDPAGDAELYGAKFIYTTT